MNWESSTDKYKVLMIFVDVVIDNNIEYHEAKQYKMTTKIHNASRELPFLWLYKKVPHLEHQLSWYLFTWIKQSQTSNFGFNKYHLMLINLCAAKDFTFWVHMKEFRWKGIINWISTWNYQCHIASICNILQMKSVSNRVLTRIIV